MIRFAFTLPIFGAIGGRMLAENTVIGNDSHMTVEMVISLCIAVAVITRWYANTGGTLKEVKRHLQAIREEQRAMKEQIKRLPCPKDGGKCGWAPELPPVEEKIDPKQDSWG